MALSDLAVFNEYAYSIFTEVLAQNVELFNAASDGTLVLRVAAISGDFSDTSFYAALPGLVRRRNPYADGTIAEKVLSQKIDTIVKVAAGTPPVRIDPAWYAWILRNPSEAAVVLGKQLAKQVLADKLNVALGTVTAAISKTPALVKDISANAGGAGLPSPLSLGNTAIALGDAMGQIGIWMMHSKTWNDLYGQALTNNERLFDYGTVAVSRDPTGRRYLMVDNPNFIVMPPGGGTAKFHTLGLTSGAVDITMNDDYFENWSTTNGSENIHRTFQAEWSYNVGVKGFSYDKANGGHAPTDAALFSATSWDQTVTSIKDGPGVMLISN